MPYMARVEKVENNPEKRSKKIHSLTYLYGKTLYFLKNYTTSYYTLILP
ncbi:hypothetical protein BASH2_00305 [Bacillus anthracis]|nr:hypothetical protein BASH2_00305 [Bacillus anthracis]